MADLLNKVRLDGTFNDETPMWMETQLTVQTVDISITKTADHMFWGDGPLTYTIVVVNNDVSPITNTVLQDTLEFDKVAFVANSVEINGVPTANYSYDETTGILTVPTGGIAAGTSLTVTFRVTKI